MVPGFPPLAHPRMQNVQLYTAPGVYDLLSKGNKNCETWDKFTQCSLDLKWQPDSQPTHRYVSNQTAEKWFDALSWIISLLAGSCPGRIRDYWLRTDCGNFCLNFAIWTEVVQVILLITFTQFILVSLGLGFFGLVVVKGDSVVLGWPNLAKICHFFFLHWMENFAQK